MYSLIVLLPLWMLVPTAIYIVFTGLALTLVKLYSIGGKCRSDARLDGKTVVITGANTGIGKETALELSRRGARVLLACRDGIKGEEAAREIRMETGGGVKSYQLDLASLKSIRKFADELLIAEDRLDILINNAGVMMCPFSKTEDGFEMQMGTNHLGHFLLTNLLLDKLKQSPSARVITVSSGGHRFVGALDFDQMNKEDGYSKFKAYAQSKLANILFTRELARRLEGSNVTTYSLHPGVVRTELSRHVFSSVFHIPPIRAVINAVQSLATKSPRQGAQTSIYCAVEPSLSENSGKYYSDCAEKKPSSAAESDRDASKLWDVSAKLVQLEDMK